MLSLTLPPYIRQDLNPTCVQKIKVGRKTIRVGQPYPFNLRLMSSGNLLDGTTCTTFNSGSSNSIFSKLHPLVILDTSVPDAALVSTFIPKLLKASYTVGGQGNDYISTNPHNAHTTYRYLSSSGPEVLSLLISTIENNLLSHRDELIAIALKHDYNQDEANELITSIVLGINPKTSRIINYADPDLAFDKNVAGPGSHKDKSSWRSKTKGNGSNISTTIVRR